MGEVFQLQKNELAGIDLAGRRHPSGVIQIVGSERFIDDWPEEIDLLGTTFTLEEVVRGATDPETGAIYEDAKYA